MTVGGRVPDGLLSFQGTLAVLALHLARQIHFHAPLVAGPQSAERCSWHSPLYRFLSSSWWHPHSSLRRHVLPSPDCPAPRNTGLREPRLGQEEPSARSQGLPSDSSLKPGLLNLPEEGMTSPNIYRWGRGWQMALCYSLYPGNQLSFL